MVFSFLQRNYHPLVVAIYLKRLNLEWKVKEFITKKNSLNSVANGVFFSAKKMPPSYKVHLKNC